MKRSTKRLVACGVGASLLAVGYSLEGQSVGDVLHRESGVERTISHSLKLAFGSTAVVRCVDATSSHAQTEVNREPFSGHVTSIDVQRTICDALGRFAANPDATLRSPAAYEVTEDLITIGAAAARAGIVITSGIDPNRLGDDECLGAQVDGMIADVMGATTADSKVLQHLGVRLYQTPSTDPNAVISPDCKPGGVLDFGIQAAFPPVGTVRI